MDFGTVAVQLQNVQYKSPLHIQVTAPAGFGLANVTVANSLGTSGTTPAAAYAFGGPEPANGKLSAPSGTTGSSLKINGRGLQQATSVVFLFPGDGLGAPPNAVPADKFKVISDTEIDFAAPGLPAGVTAPSSVNVAITIGDIFAPCGSFQYTSGAADDAEVSS